MEIKKSIFNKLLNTILNYVMGSGLFWGFMITSTVGIGYTFYRFLQKKTKTARSG